MNEKSKAWLYLVIAGLLEIVWAYFLKLSHGFSLLGPTVIVLICLSISFFLLGKAVNICGIGLSYGVFTGIGIAGTTIIGILLLNESLSPGKIISLLILLCGIIGLKLCEGEKPTEESERR